MESADSEHSGDRAIPEQPNAGPDAVVEEAAPDELREVPARSWWTVLRRTVGQFTADELTDRAAALTYYAVLAIFPALLVLVSLLGLEFDAELARERAVEGGLPVDEEPYVEPRDTRTWPKSLLSATRRRGHPSR